MFVYIKGDNVILRSIALAIVYCLQTENTPLYLKQRNGVTSVLLQQTEHFLCNWYLRTLYMQTKCIP